MLEIVEILKTVKNDTASDHTYKSIPGYNILSAKKSL